MGKQKLSFLVVGITHDDIASRYAMMQELQKAIKHGVVDRENVVFGFEKTAHEEDRETFESVIQELREGKVDLIQGRVMNAYVERDGGKNCHDISLILDTVATGAMMQFCEENNMRYCQLDSPELMTEICSSIEEDEHYHERLEEKAQEYEKLRIAEMVKNVRLMVSSNEAPKLVILLVGAAHAVNLASTCGENFNNELEESNVHTAEMISSQVCEVLDSSPDSYDKSMQEIHEQDIRAATSAIEASRIEGFYQMQKDNRIYTQGSEGVYKMTSNIFHRMLDSSQAFLNTPSFSPKITAPALQAEQEQKSR